MVNPGTFRASRKEFLKGELPAYGRAVEGGYTVDGIAMICCWYFKRYPVDMSLDEEPTAEHLAGVDDDAIEPDDPPMDTQLSLEEFIEERLRCEEHSALIIYRQAVRSSYAVFDSNWIAYTSFSSKSNVGSVITTCKA